LAHAAVRRPAGDDAPGRRVPDEARARSRERAQPRADVDVEDPLLLAGHADHRELLAVPRLLVLRALPEGRRQALGVDAIHHRRQPLATALLEAARADAELADQDRDPRGRPLLDHAGELAVRRGAAPRVAVDEAGVVEVGRVDQALTRGD